MCCSELSNLDLAKISLFTFHLCFRSFLVVDPVLLVFQGTRVETGSAARFFLLFVRPAGHSAGKVFWGLRCGMKKEVKKVAGKNNLEWF